MPGQPAVNSFLLIRNVKVPYLFAQLVDATHGPRYSRLCCFHANRPLLFSVSTPVKSKSA